MPVQTLPTSGAAVTFNTQRTRAYLMKLPLFTRATILIIILTWILTLVGKSWSWDVKTWGALIPDEIGIATCRSSFFSGLWIWSCGVVALGRTWPEGRIWEAAMQTNEETPWPWILTWAQIYRINTFPFIHLNIFHTILNIVAFTPLLERFEHEYGTLTAVALFFGPFATIPGLMYTFVERYILHSNTAVMGASMWVFLLLGAEAIRTYKTNPYFTISTYNIPTWLTPLLLVVVTAALLPSSSFLGHLAGLLVGYGWGFGYLKFLAPPEWALRFIEGKLNLLGRLPHYVSVDQKTFGRFGVLPSSASAAEAGIPFANVSGGQR
ncbi:rhomboid protein 2 [Sordaria brevicollis]|uniref:rhomboid protease n=1 Tax=Sordaria brevicollis TaxID=83679 RepID=A0AAE0U5R6_SORBR|nr:rhomboid protein 2 [Sordaria brevicollis]